MGPVHSIFSPPGGFDFVLFHNLISFFFTLTWWLWLILHRHLFLLVLFLLCGCLYNQEMGMQKSTCCHSKYVLFQPALSPLTPSLSVINNWFAWLHFYLLLLGGLMVSFLPALIIVRFCVPFFSLLLLLLKGSFHTSSPVFPGTRVL